MELQVYKNTTAASNLVATGTANGINSIAVFVDPSKNLVGA